LELAQRPEFKDLANDKDFLQLIDTEAKPKDILQYPKVNTMLTNATIVSEVVGVIGPDLDDLQTFLATGQSPKYDPETILGVWDIDRAATMAQVLKTQPGLTPKKIGAIEQDLFPLIKGLSLTVTPDNQAILKKPDPNNGESTIVSVGTWKKDQDNYQITLPGLLPETAEVEFEHNNRMFLPKFGYVTAFDKE
jgi:hypothetical protein